MQGNAASKEQDSDPFFTSCDQFMEQLSRDANSIKRKSRRKKMKEAYLQEKSLLQLQDDETSETKDMLIPKQEKEAYEEIPELVPTKTVVKQEIEVKQEVEIKQEVKVKIEKIVVDCDTKDKPVVVVRNIEIKKEEESSDEDVPLSQRKTALQREKEKNIKRESPKKEPCDSEESSTDEVVESVAQRLRVRKPKLRSSSEEKRSKVKSSPRSKESSSVPPPRTKSSKKQSDPKKMSFGDGTDFRPGWEEEVYRYKRSLRMPPSLISISRAPNWHRATASLPDLDPYPMDSMDSMDISLQSNKRFDSDIESTSNASFDIPIGKSEPNDCQNKQKIEEKNSFLNRLVQRYGGKGKKSLRKNQEQKESPKERKGPKIIPQKSGPELLPTPSLDVLVRSPNKKLISNSNTQGRSPLTRSSKKAIKVDSKADCDIGDESVYLGYFRKKTVAEFRDAFVRYNGGFATEHELPPIVLKSRTRTQTRVMKQRATIREVFGEDRPASAPPAACREDSVEKVQQKDEPPAPAEKKSPKNKANSGDDKSVVQSKQNKITVITTGNRPGLRSAALVRSSKAVMKSKQQLLHGGERRKRNIDLLKAFAASGGKKLHQDHGGSDGSEEQGTKPQNTTGVSTTEKVEDSSVPSLSGEKRLKLRTMRRKLKSSGFDYIRKKKKQQQKKDTTAESDAVKEKRKVIATIVSY